MKISELYESDINDDINRELDDALTLVRAENIESIYMHQLEKQLEQHGLEVPNSELLDYLESKDYVKNIEKLEDKRLSDGRSVYKIEFVNIDDEEPVENNDDMELDGFDEDELESDDEVEELAKDQATKSIQND